jgi:methionyl-tRNA formyltransferase
MLKIGILGCKGTTLDLMSSLTDAGVPIDRVITLNQDVATRNKVANEATEHILRYAASGGIKSFVADDYSLSADRETEHFRDARLDLLFVLGWERLLPASVLSSLGRFACGMHGSSYGLPYGRGRSPLNWSLITGQRKFVTYLFRYTPGIDDGDVLGFRVFDINSYDDIGSLHHKNRISMCELILESLPAIETGKIQFWNQPTATPTYYPRRTDDDGLIDWTASPTAICRFVRALSPPYPGAFAELRGTRIRIAEAVPFDSTLGPRLAAPGTVVDVSKSSGAFVVQARGGSVLVRRHTSPASLQLITGDVLDGDDWQASGLRFEERYSHEVRPEQMEISNERTFS